MERKPLRIGLTFEYATLNGGEQSMLAVIDQLQDRGCQFFAFVCDSGPLVESLQARSVPVTVRTSTGETPGSSLTSDLTKFAEREDIDLLHANSLTLGRKTGCLAKTLSIPTSCHIRDIMKLSKSAIRDLNQHRLIVAVSAAARDYHVQQGIDSEKIVTVYNGINQSKFFPVIRTGSLCRELDLPESSFLIASIGQICLRKGQDDVSTAVTLLKESCPELHFLLVGVRHSTKQESIEYDQRINTIFQAAGMEDRLHRLGFRSDVPGLLNEIDLLVHTARQEPLGRVLLEAAMCETPIVATDVGGTSEILTDQKSALLVEPGKIPQIADAIQKLCADRQLRCRLASAARQDAISRFDIVRNAEILLDQWKRITFP